MKVLILDSGPLINLSMNGLLYLLEELKKGFDGKFIITKQVKKEVYDHPVGIKRFELGALKIQDLIDKRILEFPDALGIDEANLDIETRSILDFVNHSFRAENQWIEIVNEAEISCLALSSELSKKGIENLIAIDERTARVLCEKPKNLEKLMSKKLHKRVQLENPQIKKLSNFRFIRSPELVFVAYKKNLVKLKGLKVLDALLYATKYKGSSISFEEIEQMKKL